MIEKTVLEERKLGLPPAKCFNLHLTLVLIVPYTELHRSAMEPLEGSIADRPRVQ